MQDRIFNMTTRKDATDVVEAIGYSENAAPFEFQSYLVRPLTPVEAAAHVMPSSGGMSNPAMWILIKDKWHPAVVAPAVEVDGEWWAVV